MIKIFDNKKSAKALCNIQKYEMRFIKEHNIIIRYISYISIYWMIKIKSFDKKSLRIG